ncbi:MAG: Zn-dependent hydrolase [Eubacteriales bacterium]|nr:Zn-dependent hydrolase [Eubacteriales bacterium]
MHKHVERIQARLDSLYKCGLQADGTHTRMAFSPEDRKGRKLFASWFQELGIPVRQDAAGNLIARWEGENPDLPPIIMGSHLDTVPDGGKYDGVVGCVAGLEVCQTLIEEKLRCDHPLEVIVFSDEEGFRFSAGLMGSTAFVGEPLPLQAGDLDFLGRRRDEVYQEAGISFEQLAEAQRLPQDVHCCLELHVEQGRSLERQALPVGIVSSIAGVKRMEISIRGEANHAGSTQMTDRKDALVAAARFIAQLPDLVKALGNPYTVATVGCIRVEPAAVNVIPGQCIFSLEIRDQEAAIMDQLAASCKEELNRLCRESQLSFEWQDLLEHAPMPMHEDLKALIQEQAQLKAIPCTSLPSGAFHDSLLLAGHFPTAMIFVNSVGGKSHCKEEYTKPEDLGLGFDLLLASVLAADKIKF